MMGTLIYTFAREEYFEVKHSTTHAELGNTNSE